MKEKFIKSTIILVIGGFITKILSLAIRVIITRTIGLDGIGLYTLVLPSFNLFITIATMSLPIAISKLVSENKRNNKKLILGIIPVCLIFNLVIIIIIILLSSFISDKLLHNKLLKAPLICTSITLPFITISSIIRGYFFGKEKMSIHVLSNIIEQIVRIIVIIYLTPYFLKKGIYHAVSSVILFNVISELSSIIVFIFFIPKKTVISKEDFKFDKKNIKDLVSVSVPTTVGRLISSIGNFLEPIIITHILISLNYTNQSITSEFGIINGYVIPMVTMPSFLTGAISSALLPPISKYFVRNQKKEIKRTLKLGILISIFIGFICTFLLFMYPKFFLKTIFKTNYGINYLKFASIMFLSSYIIGPISSVLQAINKSNKIMLVNIIGVIIKTIVLILTCYLDIKMYSLLISYFVQFIYTLFHYFILLKKYFDN